MRDPKTHAKVLAKRWDAVCDAQLQLRDKFGTDLKRWRKLSRLRDRVHRAEHAHRTATKWRYTPGMDTKWSSTRTQPFWVHDGEIIPDTEEDA